MLETKPSRLLPALCPLLLPGQCVTSGATRSKHPLQLQSGHYLPATGAKQKAPGRKVEPATHLSVALGLRYGQASGSGALKRSTRMKVSTQCLGCGVCWALLLLGSKPPSRRLGKVRQTRSHDNLGIATEKSTFNTSVERISLINTPNPEFIMERGASHLVTFWENSNTISVWHLY